MITTFYVDRKRFIYLYYGWSRMWGTSCRTMLDPYSSAHPFQLFEPFWESSESSESSLNITILALKNYLIYWGVKWLLFLRKRCRPGLRITLEIFLSALKYVPWFDEFTQPFWSAKDGVSVSELGDGSFKINLIDAYFGCEAVLFSSNIRMSFIWS